MGLPAVVLAPARSSVEQPQVEGIEGVGSKGQCKTDAAPRATKAETSQHRASMSNHVSSSVATSAFVQQPRGFRNALRCFLPSADPRPDGPVDVESYVAPEASSA